MNQVEQWFSILQRKRLKIADFSSIDELLAKHRQYIELGIKRHTPLNRPLGP